MLLGGENSQPSGIGDFAAGVVVLGYSADKIGTGDFQPVAELGKVGGHHRSPGLPAWRLTTLGAGAAHQPTKESVRDEE